MVDAVEELWLNKSKVIVTLAKYDHKGDITGESVEPEMPIHITNRDRAVNEDRTRDPNMNPFRNGTLEPIRIGDETSDFKDVAGLSSNWLSEDELLTMLSGNKNTFKKRIAEMDSEPILYRILDLAKNDDNGASLAQIRAIQDRLEEVQPEQVGQEVVRVRA